MLTPAAKRRRRAEAATATLARPFRSPAVRRGGAAAAAVGTGADGPKTAPPSSPDRKHKRPSQIGLDSPAASATTGAGPRTVPRALGSVVDQFCLDLDAGDAALEALQAAAAAPALMPSPAAAAAADDADELPALIARWREAGRLAADDVLAVVSERVARAGGVKAWRVMTAVPPATPPTTAGDDDDDERQNEEDGAAEDAADDPRELTMAMMLASLHVDPDLLGYDEAEERWKD